MSIEEQDQIHGRLMRERSESRKRLAAIDAKLRAAFAVLDHLAEALRAAIENPGAAGIARVDRVSEDMLTREALRELLNDLHEERKKLAGLDEQLAMFE